jgi:neutral ceramidase
MKAPLALFLLASLALSFITDASAAESWQAGVAKTIITPDHPIRLSGYGGRDGLSQGKLTELYAKALALEDAAGQRAIIVTMDLVGIGRDLSRKICARISEQHKLPRSTITLLCSHTHTGPVVGDNLVDIPAHVTPEERKVIEEYAVELADKVVAVVSEAMKNLQPAELHSSIGLATFAVNRRNNVEKDVPALRERGRLVGPVDHDVPILAVRDPQGKLRAVLCGYACHATVLGDYAISGDWPAFAQLALEERHPDAVALYWDGCGGDQNPLPRRSAALAKHYGEELARAVDEVLKAPMPPVKPTLKTSYAEINLPLGKLPTRDELQSQAQGDNTAARRAVHLLAILERDGKFQPTYPYPVQVWKLGDELNWIVLGGEVVVDYSLRLKHELGPDHTWVASYANDVMNYIPSRRVLLEGGYEGGGATVPYGLPAPWNEEVEERIVGEIHRQTDALK